MVTTVAVTVVWLWWDGDGGGDGGRMVTMVAEVQWQ